VALLPEPRSRRPVMSPNLRIASRFLTAKKRAMVMSLSCIVLGVGLFVVTQATTSGVEQFFIKTILGTNGAISDRGSECRTQCVWSRLAADQT